MAVKLIWDEAKRLSNLAKHGFDFAQADAVLDAQYRQDAPFARNGETRGFVTGLRARVSCGVDGGAYRPRWYVQNY